MSLRRLLGLGLSGRSLSITDLPGRLRRSLSSSSTASSHPPWAIIDDTTMVDRSSSAPGVRFRRAQPPGVSNITAAAHLVGPRDVPAADSNVIQVLGGEVSAASGDGHLLLSYLDLQAEASCTAWELTAAPEIQRFVYNPVSGQALPLPDIDGSKRALFCHRMGLLTQADGGLGRSPPDRFAVAELVGQGAALVRFLSEEGTWRTVMLGRPSLLPRRMDANQSTVAFGGRLWWVDLTFGAISVDPFSDRPESHLVELPSGSVLPERPVTFAVDGDLRKVHDKTSFMLEVARHRRVGVSEGMLRYAEVSPVDPFLLSYYVLDDDNGSGWTLEHQVALKQVLADGGYPSASAAPQIAVLDPLNANAIYLKVGKNVVIVDMHNVKVIGASPLEGDYFSLLPCVFPPWLGSSRIPSTPGNNDDMEGTDDLVSCVYNF
ncbi:uncharacterized protein LOC123395321 [Hordeum vulgare subsp. vulgare]|uniref:uncharacterized protein LOC123395321 n=1 Tax=Hordeum vulgare subsp. vulgare TaxID=112509 RepID=UPI00029554BA|nr:uncharacterized protein LOC123395321 [Hordeum vulgare subsp. vulgare]